MEQFGCPLCGKHHKIEFHSYPRRGTFDNAGKKTEIRVVTLICTALKGTENQYTMRILPPHLIPRSPFSSAGIVKLLREKWDTENTLIEKTCTELNCIDARTAKKHLRFVRSTIDAKLPAIAEIIATSPNPSVNFSFPPGLSPLTILSLLWNIVLSIIKERSGTIATLAIERVLWIFPGFETWENFNRSCIMQTSPP